jgi:hypothetical protein
MMRPPWSDFTDDDVRRAVDAVGARPAPSIEHVVRAVLAGAGAVPHTDVEQVREALARAHRALDREHGHTAETWDDRARWNTVPE